MKTEIKILKSLIEEKKGVSIIEISRKINSDYRITHNAAKNLITKELIRIEKIGKSNVCHLTNNFSIEIYEAEDQRRNEILKNKNIKQLQNEILTKCSTALFIFLLFGSYAKKSQTTNSDIDLMFICNDKDFEERISDILSILPLKTHPLVFSEEEFIKMKDSKKSNVVIEAMQNAVIMYGIENFYRLKNA